MLAPSLFMVKVGVFVPASVLFPESEGSFAEFRSLLQGLSRTDVLFWCARLNHILAGTTDLSHEQRQAFGLRQFCTNEQLRLLDAYCSQQSRTTCEVVIFFRGQLLELLRWTALYSDDHPDDGTTFEDPSVRGGFLQACLLAGEFWGQRIYGNTLNLNAGIATARKSALGPFRSAMEANAVAGEWAHHLGRGYQLFTKYLPNVDASFAPAFERSTGLTVEEYLTCWAAVLTTYAKRNTETTIFNVATAADPTANPELFKRFTTIESQTPKQLRESLWPGIKRDNPHVSPTVPYMLKPIRERPILHSTDGRSLLIDPVCALDKASIGPLFHALRQSTNANALFAAFGTAFEQYALDVLRRTFPASPSIPSPLTCNVTWRGRADEEYEVDALLNYVTDLVLLEIKAVWARDADFAPERVSSLLTHLREQFGVTENSVRGAGQLARVINALASKTWSGPDQSFLNARTVYPVLVVHDRSSAAPGFGTFIVEEFRRGLAPYEIGGTGDVQLGALRVIAPIVLTVDDLELLEGSLEYEGLLNLLNEFDNWSKDRMAPFGDFLAEKSRLGRIYANRALAGIAAELMTKTIKRFFPHSLEKPYTC